MDWFVRSAAPRLLCKHEYLIDELNYVLLETDHSFKSPIPARRPEGRKASYIRLRKSGFLMWIGARRFGGTGTSDIDEGFPSLAGIGD
jgi:hypothetical protein